VKVVSRPSAVPHALEGHFRQENVRNSGEKGKYSRTCRGEQFAFDGPPSGYQVVFGESMAAVAGAGTGRRP